MKLNNRNKTVHRKGYRRDILEKISEELVYLQTCGFPHSHGGCCLGARQKAARCGGLRRSSLSEEARAA